MADPRIEADNERIRREKIAQEKANVKKHGDTMGKVARGEYGSNQSGNSGCAVVAMIAASPLALWVADKLV